MTRLDEIIEKRSRYLPHPNVEILRKAFTFSAKVHKDQVRLSGEPYFNHPVEVAYILAELRMDEYCIVAGLLHDVLEDTLTTYDQLVTEFGSDVAQIVDGVTKISKLQFSSSIERKAENYRKMILAMARDLRVIITKLADRLHNMRTLDYQAPSKQESISRETMDIYAPLAHRLGMSAVKTELEDLAFKYLNPDVYEKLKSDVDARVSERNAYVTTMKETLQAIISSHGIRCEVSGRVKHLHSIWQKMMRKEVGLEDVYDLVAFRVLVDSVKDCYGVLGIIHSKWRPLPGRFKDFIAVPKHNMYQSLHTTVIGPESERIEIQIRTFEMHRVAELGIAAHWKYKEGKGIAMRDEERFAWLRQLLEWQEDTTDARDFLETMKTELFTEEVYVFTPRGDIKPLPKGSTPVDFAYSVHSDVGNRCVGAKVNGRIVPLRHELKTGDVVEVVTSPQQKPSRDWLKFVKTNKAKAKIRQVVKEYEHERSIEIGHELLDKALKRHELSFSRISRQEMGRLLRTMGFSDEKELFSAIGFGNVSPYHVITELFPDEKRKVSVPVETPGKKPSGKDGIVIKEMDDVLVKFARCCSPIPGDRVVGFISRGKGITVHTFDCPNVMKAEPERLISVSWDPAKKTPRPVWIRVECADEKGLLSSISSAISAQNVNISSARSMTHDRKAYCDFELQVSDHAQLQRVIDAIGQIRHVQNIERMKSLSS